MQCKKEPILIVGQIPPPHIGQAISIKLMLEGTYKKIQLYHVEMKFSQTSEQVGVFQLIKLVRLFKLIIRIFYVKYKYNIDILYYVPAGPQRIPFYRDVFILIATRKAFKKIVFQFRAAGLSQLYPKLNFIEKKLFNIIYKKVDLSMHLFSSNVSEGRFLNARKSIVTKNGDRDHYLILKHRIIDKKRGKYPNILYVGTLIESKGLFDLLKACFIIKKKGYHFNIRIIGEFVDLQFKSKVNLFVNENGLDEYVEFLGLKTEDEKWLEYYIADIFVFPTFYENEASPRVIIEAMQFSLPVISTKWRGIPELVEDGFSGLLVEVGDFEKLAIKIEELLKNKFLRRKFGHNGRKLFLEKYTEKRFYSCMEKAFLSITEQNERCIIEKKD